MKTNERLGGILAAIAAIMGIVVHFVLFLAWYEAGMGAESAEPGCEILLKYIHPGLAYMGIMGGVLFAVSAYGYFTGKGRTSLTDTETEALKYCTDLIYLDVGHNKITSLAFLEGVWASANATRPSAPRRRWSACGPR